MCAAGRSLRDRELGEQEKTMSVLKGTMVWGICL